MQKAALLMVGKQKVGEDLAATFAFTVLIGVKLLSGNSNFN